MSMIVNGGLYEGVSRRRAGDRTANGGLKRTEVHYIYTYKDIMKPTINFEKWQKRDWEI
jgi:hypothetical protein